MAHLSSKNLLNFDSDIFSLNFELGEFSSDFLLRKLVSNQKSTNVSTKGANSFFFLFPVIFNGTFQRGGFFVFVRKLHVLFQEKMKHGVLHSW